VCEEWLEPRQWIRLAVSCSTHSRARLNQKGMRTRRKNAATEKICPAVQPDYHRGACDCRRERSSRL
jgi:hypothetical protein